MTQDYTPTTDEVCECWTIRDDIGNPYETDANVEERHHEERVKFDRWLAAHDAQIRADEHVKALELTDYEIEIMADAYSNSDEFNHGDDVGAMSVAVQAIIKHRREQKQ